MHRAIKSGVWVNFRGKSLSTADEDVLIETTIGPVRIPVSMIVSVEVQEVKEGSPVSSTLPNRTGLTGIVLCMSDDDAWVHWQNGRKSTEKVNTLRIALMSPT